MTTGDYDVSYDPNEVDADNQAPVLRDWARAGLEITIGRTILAGDDELEPVPARILAYNDNTGIITIELLLGGTHSAVARASGRRQVRHRRILTSGLTSHDRFLASTPEPRGARCRQRPQVLRVGVGGMRTASTTAFCLTAG